MVFSFSEMVACDGCLYLASRQDGATAMHQVGVKKPSRLLAAAGKASANLLT